MLEFADSHFAAVETSKQDEIGRYMNKNILEFELDKESFMKGDFAAITFWHSRRNEFPILFKVARRIYSTPVSSCASERVFSAVKRIVNHDRTRLSSGSLEDVVFLRSALAAGKKL